jgi:myo-inositol-1(or 4)-monophosphatase
MGPTSTAGMSQIPRRLPLRDPVPSLPGLHACVVAVEWGSDREGNNWDARAELFSKLGRSAKSGGGMVHGFRSTGSAALSMCAVAAGELDVCWEAGAWSWDVCAAWAIVEEAGGRVVDSHPREGAKTWAERAPALDGRTFLSIRAAGEKEQEKIVDDIWALTTMRFQYA